MRADGVDSRPGNKNGNPESLVALFVLILEVRSRNFRLPVEKLCGNPGKQTGYHSRQDPNDRSNHDHHYPGTNALGKGAVARP